MGLARTGGGLWAILVLANVAAAPPATTRVAPPPPPPPRGLIDSANMATQAQSAGIEIQQMLAVADDDPLAARVSADLPPVVADLPNRAELTEQLLVNRPPLQVLDGQAADWEAFQRELDGWYQGLDHRRAMLDEMLRTARPDARPPVPPGRLQALADAWQAALDESSYYMVHPKAAGMAGRMAALHRNAESVLLAIGQAREEVQAKQSDTYGLLQSVNEQQALVNGEVNAVRRARDQAWNRLFQRDGDPVWALHRRPGVTTTTAAGADGGPDAEAAAGTIGPQLRAVRTYARRVKTNLGLQVTLASTLATALLVGRRWVRRWADADPSLNRATLAFTAPIATALVVSFLASVWIYPQAPRLFWAGIGALALVPTVFLLRRVVERRLFRILYALVAFYAADQVRLVAASVPVLARALFLAEMLAGVLLLGLLVRARWDHRPADAFGWTIRIAARVWLGVMAACLLADAVGFVSLAELVGGAALGAAYLGVILYACTRVVGGLAVLLLRSRPLTLLNGVRRHQPLLLRRAAGLLAVLAAAFWVWAVLEMLSARPVVFAWVSRAWNLPLSLGAVSFTPSHVLKFALTIYAAVLVSRFVRYVLDEDVYAHVAMPTGLSYAVNRMVHYLLLLAGFYLAMAVAGVSFTSLTLLATAFTVGLGFGLQNVVNNFVSGLILLFERPIKVDDLVQLGDTVGTVEYIGIRASILRTAESAEVIVPNGNLLSSQLTNFTLSNRQRGLMIALSLSADADPQRVMALLTTVAAAHPLVVTQPPPQATLTKFAADSFGYELRAWTNAAEQWWQIRSDLAVSLHAALTGEGIGIK